MRGLMGQEPKRGGKRSLWRRKWQPTPVFLPRKFDGQSISLVGYCPCGHKESEQLSRTSLRYADDTTLMAESKEELKNLLMKLKEESEKAGLKLNIQKTKIMVFNPISSRQIDEEKWQQCKFYFLGVQNHCGW